MNSGFVDILKKLIAEQGKEALLNHAKCKAFLADYTSGEYKKESRFLLQAIDAGAQKAIDATGELELCKQQQARVLHEEYGMDQQIAADVVDTLALVLRGVHKSSAPQSAVCANCGKQLQKEWKACPYCSTPVAKAGAAGGSAQAVKPSQAAGPAAKPGPVDYDAAITEYTEAISLNPKNVAAYIGRGNAYRMKEFYDAAINDFTEAIRLDPKNADAYLGRAHVYEEAGGYTDEAFKDFDKVIKLNPKSADAYIGRGNVYFYNDKYNKAINDYTEAIRLDPKNVDAYIGRGKAYFGRGRDKDSDNHDKAVKDYTEAISDFTQAIKLDPGNAAAYIDRGNAYESRGQYDLAVKDFNEASRLDPKISNWWKYVDPSNAEDGLRKFRKK